jgi:OOP family OmpA-OmpF porin
VNAADRCPGTPPDKLVSSYGCERRARVSMRLEVLFPTGQRELNDEANARLNSLARFLEEHPGAKLEIQGHTDNVGQSTRNKELSEDRANAVKEYLVEESGIPPSRISTYGYCDRKPIRENSTPENRRVLGIITQ